MSIDDCIDCDKRKAAEDCNCIPIENADGTLQDIVLGCTDPLASNYNSLANCDDGSCIDKNPGCMNPSATYGYSTCYNADCAGNLPGSAAYIAAGTYGDTSCCCETAGCMDPAASNYNSSACVDDGTCTYPGCTDNLACNYNPSATVDDGSCSYPTSNSTTAQDCGSYTWSVNGQTYTASGTYTDIDSSGTCDHTETLNLTINQATTGILNDTGCLTYTWSGPQGNGNTYTTSGTYTSVTTNASGCNHTETLNLTITGDGCTDATANNYDPTACADDGSCTYPNPEPPVFKTNVSQGTCGADSVPPTFTGAVGGTYIYNGHYCDEDHTYDQLTLTSEYSTDGGTTYTPGLPAGWTLQKDLAGGAAGNNQFTLTGPVAAGQTLFKLRVEDPGALFAEQIVTVSAAYQIIQNMQFQIGYTGGTTTAGNSIVHTMPATTGLNTYTAPQSHAGLTLPGPPLWNRSILPVFSIGGSSTNNSYNGITASGGTYGGLGGGTTFTLFRKGNEIGASLESCSNPGNVAVGQTIEFDVATLNAAFATNDLNFTGPMEFTIVEEDIMYAPNSTVSIPLVAESNNTHGCADGGFRLQLSCVNQAGETIYRKSRKINTNNSSSDKQDNWNSVYARRWSNESFDPPAGWTRASNTDPTWSRNYPNSWSIHTNDTDQTDSGIINDARQTQNENIWGYFPVGYTWGYSGRNSGLFKLTDSIINDLSSQSANGVITARLIGDQWNKCSGSGALATVASVDANGGIITLGAFTAGGSNYITNNSSQNNTAYYIKAITGSGSGAFIRADKSAGNVLSAHTDTSIVPTVQQPGENYQVGDQIEFDGDNTWVANAHGDASIMRIFREDPSNPGSHIEVGIGTNGQAISAGDGTSVEIDLFNNTVTVV
tara:strand:- start:49738 stop:52395 length:2658 start_codon:yes stop_codon:yes gene_type:complete